MEEPLRVLVSVDTKKAAASIEVRGSLTGSNCGTLLNILRHTATLGANILINLSRAVRVEDAALEVLRGAARDVERTAPPEDALQVGVQLPPEDPAQNSPAGGHGSIPLANDAAVEMILARDPRVLPRRRS